MAEAFGSVHQPRQNWLPRQNLGHTATAVQSRQAALGHQPVWPRLFDSVQKPGQSRLPWQNLAEADAWACLLLCFTSEDLRNGRCQQDLSISMDWLPGLGADWRAAAGAAGLGLREGPLAVLWMHSVPLVDASLLKLLASQTAASYHKPVGAGAVTCLMVESWMA